MRNGPRFFIAIGRQPMKNRSQARRVKTDVASIRDDVSALKKQVVWLARSGEIDALHHDIGRLQLGVADLEARLEVIEQAQRLTSLGHTLR